MGEGAWVAHGLAGSDLLRPGGAGTPSQRSTTLVTCVNLNVYAPAPPPPPPPWISHIRHHHGHQLLRGPVRHVSDSDQGGGGGAGAPTHWQSAATLHCRGFPHSLPDHQGAHTGGAGEPTIHTRTRMTSCI